MQKILTIVWKELYTTYTDRSLLLIMLATPFALATIISLAFSGFIGGGSDVPIQDIPVAVVNLDAGTTANGQFINYGDFFVQALVPPADATAENLAGGLYALTDAVALASADEARARVDAGTLTAAVVIPIDFSARVSALSGNPVDVEVYASRAAPISSNIIYSLVQGITNRITAGDIAVASANAALTNSAEHDPRIAVGYLLGGVFGRLNDVFGAAFTQDADPITVEQQTVAGETATSAFNPLVQFGSAQAIFFMTFTAFGSVAAFLQERRDGTLQRMLITPTPRILILIGRLLGTFCICTVQVALLLLALTVMGSLIAGQLQFIWGTNLLAIVAVVLFTAMAICGLATFIAGLARTPEQVNIVGGVIALGFALLSGVFFDVGSTPLAPLSRFTPNYWGMDAFIKLSFGDAGIGLNLLVLLMIGATLFVVGFVLFNRRLEV